MSIFMYILKKNLLKNNQNLLKTCQIFHVLVKSTSQKKRLNDIVNFYLFKILT